MLRRVFAVVVCLLASAVQAEKPIDDYLPRTKPWNIVYENGECDLYGVFGEGNKQITLKMSQFSPGPSFTLVMYGAPFRSKSNTDLALVDFGPIANPLRKESMNGSQGEKPMMNLGQHRLDDSKSSDNGVESRQPVDAAPVDTLTVKIVGGQTVRLKLGSMAGPMKALGKCTDDLVESWGYDVEEQRTLISGPKPRGRPRNWLKSSDYPSYQLFDGQSAIIDFRLDVDAEGAVTGCSILQGIGDKNFADITCKAISKRAKFEAARNAAGKPVRSFFVSSARWIIRV